LKLRKLLFKKKINAHVHIPCALSVLAKKHYSSWCFQAQGGYSSFGKLVLEYNMDLQVNSKFLNLAHFLSLLLNMKFEKEFSVLGIAFNL
jgi:hypothetical protein